VTSALRPGGSTRAWRKLRAAAALTLPRPCSRCGELVLPDQAWHLDHLVARVDGGDDQLVAPAHALCNLRAGQTASRQLRPPTYQAPSW
jgi:hypothetical protein